MTRLHRAQRAFLCAFLLLSACRDKSEERAAAFAARARGGLPPVPGHAGIAPGPAAPTAATGRTGPIFSEREGGVAQIVEEGGGFVVVHNGSTGKRYALVREVVLSRDGRRCAYGAGLAGKWRMVVDGKESEPFDSVGTPVFSPDGKHLLYPSLTGDRWSLVVDGKARSAGSTAPYVGYAFGADAARVFYVEVPEGKATGALVVSDARFVTKPVVVDPSVSQVIPNAAGTRVAAISVAAGRQQVITVDLAKPERSQRGPSFDAVSNLVFAPDGGALAYLGERGTGRSVVLDGVESPITGGHVVVGPVISGGARVVGVLIASLGGSVVLREFPARGGAAEAAYDEAEGLTYSADGAHRAYAARKGTSWHLVLDGKAGPAFDRVVSPAFSQDGKQVAYRARQNGSRFVVVADTAGGAVTRFPPHEQVFPVLFTADGKSVAYGVKDGARVAWQVEER